MSPLGDRGRRNDNVGTQRHLYRGWAIQDKLGPVHRNNKRMGTHNEGRDRPIEDERRSWQLAAARISSAPSTLRYMASSVQPV